MTVKPLERFGDDQAVTLIAGVLLLLYYSYIKVDTA